MKILIKSDKSKIVLRFPTCFLLNRITAGIMCRVLKKEGVHITQKQAVSLIKEIRRCKTKFRDWNFVEITDNNNDRVIIKI